jgi:hypothetical protein
MQQAPDHHCLPRTARPCPKCGELLPVSVFCETCGADITPQHVCAPHPLPHVCPPGPAPARCLDCGQALPARLFCRTCGEEITPSHRCPAAPPTHVHRADPVHTCRAEKLQRCSLCGALMPARVFCEQCGMEITPAHVCTPQPTTHICPPVVTMPRRCSHCGEMLPAPKHCAQCGADITPVHVCGK